MTRGEMNGSTDGTGVEDARNAPGVTSDDLPARVEAFLRTELARMEGRMCMRIDLVRADQSDRSRAIRSWDRGGSPKRDESIDFNSPSGAERLSSDILRVARGDASRSGHSRYAIRTTQALGGRMKFGFQINAEDDDPDEAREATPRLRGPLHLSLHCDGVDVDVDLTAGARKRATSVVDAIFQSMSQFMPHIASQFAPGSCPSLIDVVRARLEAGASSIDENELARAVDVLLSEHDRRKAREERAGSASSLGDLGDVVLDHLAIHRVADRDLVEAIDLIEAHRARDEATPS